MGSIQPSAASQGSTLPAPGNPAGSATVPAAGQAVDTSHRVVLDGGGKVTLSGGGAIFDEGGRDTQPVVVGSSVG